MSRMTLRSARALRPTSLPRRLPAWASSIRSMPAEKCLPAPERTTTRTSSVSSAQRKMSMISVQKSSFIELALSGRLIATWAILSESSTRKALYSDTTAILGTAVGGSSYSDEGRATITRQGQKSMSGGVTQPRERSDEDGKTDTS
ncbi:hypothetical protein D9M71_560440 [compost metagenome]